MEFNKNDSLGKSGKLNVGRTFIIGFAFFGILMLWQVYNTYCPTILTELLGKQIGVETKDNTQVQWIVGIIMALDNVLALFMLPLFGNLSDKTNTKFGKRMPYIVIGTVLASIALIFIPIAFAYESLVGVILSMLFVLVFMNAYRNPAVSLMPDITPKPLRAKANGIINLVGYIGAILAGALAMIITTEKFFKLSSEGYGKFMMHLPFIIAAAMMIITCLVLALTIKENKIIKEMQDELKRGELVSEVKLDEKEEKLSKKNRNDLIKMIIAIFFWFAAFNAVETFWSNYSLYYLHFEKYSMATIILTIASLITFIPAGFLADKIGRKWSVLIGIGMMVASMLGCFFLSPLILGDAGNVTNNKGLAFAYYGIFAFAGVGWALINCSSYPMVVELSTQKTVGKFTGYYYTSSMLAQSLTPIALGALFFVGFGTGGGHNWAIMFPYSCVLFIAALIIFVFVGNVKVNKEKSKKGLEAFDQD